MKLSEIIDALDGKLLTGDGFLEKNITTCGASDLMSDILAGLSEGCILLTGLTTVQVIRTAMVAGVGAVVFVRDKTPPAEVVELAEGDAVECRAADKSAELVQVTDRDFHRILIQKFGLSER